MLWNYIKHTVHPLNAVAEKKQFYKEEWDNISPVVQKIHRSIKWGCWCKNRTELGLGSNYFFAQSQVGLKSFSP